jgi:hypothetical protein
MFGSLVLEVAIGVVLVFLLFSTICAALREGIEAWTKTRAAYLERGLRELLHDQTGIGLAREFYEHPMIFGLYSAGAYLPGAPGNKVGICPGGGQLPSYIPSKNFAAVMIDLAARGPLPNFTEADQKAAPALSAGSITAASLRAGIAKMENQRVARAMLNALDLAHDDLNQTRLNLEAWYDAGMDRVSGWYKRSTQWIVFWLALVMAVMLNIDAIGIANFLYQNDNARHAVVAEASRTVAKTTAPNVHTALATNMQYEASRVKLDTLNLPIGWEPGGFTCNAREPLFHCSGARALTLLGWFLTAVAATLGAPFWFDVLNKVSVIRSTVKPYEKSRPEGSEDR